MRNSLVENTLNKRLLAAGCIFLLFTGEALAVKCADFNSCREAVEAWCSGRHSRADGDGDGIPCENICRSLEQVNQIRREIGC